MNPQLASWDTAKIFAEGNNFIITVRKNPLLEGKNTERHSVRVYGRETRQDDISLWNTSFLNIPHIFRWFPFAL